MDYPERIWLENIEPNKNLIEDWLVQKEHYSGMIEYIRKDIAFPRISKEDIDRLEQIKNELKEMNKDF